mmetsp:Transcript_13127/g.28350  ORF Transcript_13127/g.28350 Transcript_13127/m.28350 type:complete len:206 (+) Transcript_13127:85-702(+)
MGSQLALLQVHLREPPGPPRARRPVQLQCVLSRHGPPARHVRARLAVGSQDARRACGGRRRAVGRRARAIWSAAGAHRWGELHTHAGTGYEATGVKTAASHRADLHYTRTYSPCSSFWLEVWQINSCKYWAIRARVLFLPLTRDHVATLRTGDCGKARRTTETAHRCSTHGVNCFATATVDFYCYRPTQFLLLLANGRTVRLERC